MKTEFKWDISLLERMRLELLNTSSLDVYYRDEDIKLIEKLLSIINHQRNYEVYSFEERKIRARDNNYYVKEEIDQTQMLYLELLDQKLDYMNPIYKSDKTEFEIEEIFELLEEFIKWFPFKTLAQFLQIYYERDFPTHFYYCEENHFLNRGSTYYFCYFTSPFMLVTKESFVDTFLTLIHEMGHVLIRVLEKDFGKSKCGALFSEIDGRYFEELARKFLEEKGFDIELILKSSIDSYNDIVSDLRQIKLPIFKKLFIDDSVEEIFSEIYSYLGALELLERYDGDYEKQLYDMIVLPSIQSDDMSEYLKSTGFHWREDNFKVLEKRKEWLRRN